MDSYMIREVLRHMSNTDWEEFIKRHPQKRSLIADLQHFLHKKYINEETTSKRT